MLCCVHLTVNLWVSSKYYGFLYLSRCLIFKVLRTFWKVFCRFLPNLSQQCVNYYITFIFVCQHFFQSFSKFFEISFITFKSFFCVFKPFCCLCFPQATSLLYHSFLQIATPFFNFFQKILNNFYFILINSIYSVYIYGIYYF